MPQLASASIFTRVAKADSVNASGISIVTNSQKMALAKSNLGPSTLNAVLAEDAPISNAALTPKMGPVGSTLDIAEIPENPGQIIIYTVRSGDSIGTIAQMFGVTKQTIMLANDLSAGDSLVQGAVLAIPQVSGRMHLVKKDDTLASLSKKYSVSALDIAIYNDLDADSTLTLGDTLVIPELDAAPANTSTTTIADKPAKTSSSTS